MSLFGEIIEPSSRATWEDWDDIESSYYLPEVKWEKPLEISEEIDRFILFEGRFLWNNIKTKKDIIEVNCIKEPNLLLYKTLENNNYVCVIRDCDLLLCNDIVKLLGDLITKSKVVVTIQEKPLSEYQSIQMPLTSYIIRKVITTNSLTLLMEDIPKLEQPNIISGVSAGVFTLREHLRISATSIVIYMEYSQECQIEDIANLLEELDITETNQMKPNMILNSNLYI